MLVSGIVGSKEAFVSLHAPGFGYHLEGQELENEAQKGDSYCQKVFEELERLELAAAPNGFSRIVIGGDFNTEPERRPQRFDQFPGFRIVRTHLPTAVYARSGECSEREIDFFLVRDKKEINVSAKALEVLSESSHEENSSDHAPILMEIGEKRAVKTPKQEVKPQPPASHAVKKPNTQSFERLKPPKKAKAPAKKRPFFLKRLLTKALNLIKKIFHLKGSRKSASHRIRRD